MQIFGAMNRAVEHLSAGKAAAIGGAGSGVSLASATLADPVMLAWVDPSALVPWLQVATLTVGLITGLGSAGLVFLKYVQRRPDASMEKTENEPAEQQLGKPDRT